MELSKNSKLYRLYLMEREEVAKLKWIESEKHGYDIGMDHAYFLWVRYHRIPWINGVMISGIN